MDHLLKFTIILLVIVSSEVNLRVLANSLSAVSRAFEAYEIVPDVLTSAPVCKVKVYFPSGVEVNLGNILTPTQVKDEPSVYWNANPENYYVLAMIDPDAPSRNEPTNREVQHWLVGNIPGNNLAAGETLSQYFGSGPGLDSGLHRYVLLVYQQPGELTFDEPRLTNRTADNRPGFSIATFAAKYKLGDPISGNFYQAEYDDYVPVLYEQLGIQK